MKPLLSALFLAVVLTGCGRAAEDRNMMHARAKVFQDSIANVIRMRLAEAEGPANTAVRVDTAAKPAPSPSNTGR
jgi:nitrous oxide reductase accessory protein NosL